jgi:hypothetical protein
MALMLNSDRNAMRPPIDLLVPKLGASRTFVHLRTLAGRAEMALLQAISTEMAHVTFQTLASPAYALGSDVEVVFPLAAKSAVFSAVVWTRTERRDERDYVLRFVGNQSEKNLLSEAIHLICNQRRVSRVSPEQRTCSMLVRGRAEDPWTPCDLKDVSSAGVGFLCRVVVEPEGLARTDTVEIKLQLPTHHAALLVVGRIVNRALFDGAVRYGTKFIEARCADFPETVKRIVEYVTLRQDEAMLERARSAAAARQTSPAKPAG